jgi:hypothetical protein
LYPRKIYLNQKSRKLQESLDSPVEPRRKSARLQKAIKTGTGKKIPSFVSDYVQGQPIYIQIRVVPQEIVAGIEDKIAEQEFQKKSKLAS